MEIPSEIEYIKGIATAATKAGIASVISSKSTFSRLLTIKKPTKINAGAVAMVAGLIVVPVVSVLTPKLKKDRVDEIFACYDEKITITKKRSLEQN